jgi:hypothetical protein
LTSPLSALEFAAYPTRLLLQREDYLWQYLSVTLAALMPLLVILVC